MTPTIILSVLIAQFVIAGIGFVAWKRNASQSRKPARDSVSEKAVKDSDRCQVLLGNIGHLLNSHSQLLRFLDSRDGLHAGSSDDPVIKTFANRKVQFGKLLEMRVDELSEVLEEYEDLYLHERLKLKDYAEQASQLEQLLRSLESHAAPEAMILASLVRDMLAENQKLRVTVEGCRNRISELVVIAMRSGRDARIDALTQLPNRRAWLERLTVLNDTQAMAAAVIDVDNFKQINDIHGHAAGDAVLRLVAKILRNETRIVPFRIGGDEFYLLIDCRSVEEARNLVEGIRTRVERASVLFDGKRLQTTITGGAAFPSEGELLDSVVQRADRAVCHAKGVKNVVALDEPNRSESVV